MIKSISTYSTSIMHIGVICTIIGIYTMQILGRKINLLIKIIIIIIIIIFIIIIFSPVVRELHPV